MAASSLGGTLANYCLHITKPKCSSLSGTRSAWTRQNPIKFANLVQQRMFLSPPVVRCSPLSETLNNLEDGSEEKNVMLTNLGAPSPLEVETLVTEICNTTSIAEFELKLGDFRLYVARDLIGKIEPPPPPSTPPVTIETPTKSHDSNGSVATTSLAISKPKPSQVGIQRLLETATDEGLVIIQSPKVGYFRRSRTIKGKRAPPSCKEKQTVKEGQVVCYIEQLGGEIPIESDVSGEVIRILRDDGEPVGYGDALIAVLPSFPGIKKLQ